jgi:trk system potassium uptake protein TrkH
VGGIKMIRALLIKKVLRWQVNKVFLSRYTVKSMKFNGKVMLPEEMNEEFTKASAFAIIFFLLVIGSSVAGALYTEGSFTYADALFESGSAQGTVGLSSGITDPGMPWGLELIYIFQMWSGRLEIIPIFALIRGLIWGTNPGKI